MRTVAVFCKHTHTCTQTSILIPHMCVYLTHWPKSNSVACNTIVAALPNPCALRLKVTAMSTFVARKFTISSCCNCNCNVQCLSGVYRQRRMCLAMCAVSASKSEVHKCDPASVDAETLTLPATICRSINLPLMYPRKIVCDGCSSSQRHTRSAAIDFVISLSFAVYAFGRNRIDCQLPIVVVLWGSLCRCLLLLRLS